jgi:hypothetical protein
VGFFRSFHKLNSPVDKAATLSYIEFSQRIGSQRLGGTYSNKLGVGAKYGILDGSWIRFGDFLEEGVKLDRVLSLG